MYDEQTSTERDGQRADRRCGVCNTEYATNWLGSKYVPKLHSAESAKESHTGSSGHSPLHPAYEIVVSKSLEQIYLHLCGFPKPVQEKESSKQHHKTRRFRNLFCFKQRDEPSKCVPSLPGSRSHKRKRWANSYAESEKDQGGQNQRIIRNIRRFALLEIPTNSIKMAQNIT